MARQSSVLDTSRRRRDLAPVTWSSQTNDKSNTVPQEGKPGQTVQKNKQKKRGKGAELAISNLRELSPTSPLCLHPHHLCLGYQIASYLTSLSMVSSLSKSPSTQLIFLIFIILSVTPPLKTKHFSLPHPPQISGTQEKNSNPHRIWFLAASSASFSSAFSHVSCSKFATLHLTSLVLSLLNIQWWLSREYLSPTPPQYNQQSLT